MFLKSSQYACKLLAAGLLLLNGFVYAQTDDTMTLQDLGPTTGQEYVKVLQGGMLKKSSVAGLGISNNQPPGTVLSSPGCTGSQAAPIANTAPCASTFNATSATSPVQFNGTTVQWYATDPGGGFSMFFGQGAGSTTTIANITAMTKGYFTCVGYNTCGGFGTGMVQAAGNAENTAIGWSTGAAWTSANYNTVVGVGSMRYDATGSNNSVLGVDALSSSVQAGSNSNAVVGGGALRNGGSNNVVMGNSALQGSSAGSTATDNVALGYQALSSTSLTTGSSNVAVGVNALQVYTGNNSTAVGGYSLQNSTAANDAFGYDAGLYIGSGAHNVAIGSSAMQGISATPITGGDNTAIGYSALFTCQGACTSNTAVGFNAIYSETTGLGNVAVGNQALFTQAGTNYNTAVGYQAGKALTSGSHNVIVGGSTTAPVLSTGGSNTILGYNCEPQSPLTSSTSNYIGICAGSTPVWYVTGGGTPSTAAQTYTGTITFPNIATDATHTDASVCEDTTTHTIYSGSGTSGICLGTSSARYKHDIAPLDLGIETVEALKPISYKLNPDHGDPDKTLYGFTAEDMQGVAPDLVGLDSKGRPNTADYVGLIPVLVKAVQEQQAEIQDLKRRLHRRH